MMLQLNQFMTSNQIVSFESAEMRKELRINEYYNNLIKIFQTIEDWQKRDNIYFIYVLYYQPEVSTHLVLYFLLIMVTVCLDDLPSSFVFARQS